MEETCIRRVKRRYSETYSEEKEKMKTGDGRFFKYNIVGPQPGNSSNAFCNYTPHNILYLPMYIVIWNRHTPDYTQP